MGWPHAQARQGWELAFIPRCWRQTELGAALQTDASGSGFQKVGAIRKNKRQIKILIGVVDVEMGRGEMEERADADRHTSIHPPVRAVGPECSLRMTDGGPKWPCLQKACPGLNRNRQKADGRWGESCPYPSPAPVCG